MAWVIVEDGAVVREFSRPTAFTYKDLQYPRNWIQNATAEEKSAIGLVEVTISGGQKSNDYYTNNLGDNVIAGDGSVSRTWSNTAIALSTVQAGTYLSFLTNGDTTTFYVDDVRIEEVQGNPGELK